MNRTSLINSLIAKIGAKSYLEIGVHQGENFNKICCANRTAVDPVTPPPITGEYKYFHSTSNEFFNSIADDHMFDVIFIDGLHTAAQVKLDISNAMKRLSTGGFILCHDMNPLIEEHQTPEYNGGHWNGDCWKAFVELRAKNTDWNFATVDTDQGCGVIWKGVGNTFTNRLPLTWNNFKQNRANWLNLISVQRFVNDILGGAQLPILLNTYLGDPEYDENNFALAMYYDGIGQKASAISFYIRAAERSSNVLLQYESLVRAALCFISQGTRGLSVRGLLQRAMALLPKRPEAYFLLSRWWERDATVEGWVNGYTLASMGLVIANDTSSPLRTWVEYPGPYGLMFEKAVTGWWVGQCAEARDIFSDLLLNYNLDDGHRVSVINNLKHLKSYTPEMIAKFGA